MYTVYITTPAEEDLLSALRYIVTVLKAPEAAEDLIGEVEKKIVVLAENPRVSPLLGDEDSGLDKIRHVKIKNYLLFYTVENDTKTITIIRFLYARRDWINLLGADSTPEPGGPGEI